MAKREKKSFILYHSYEKQIRLLTREERGDLLTAIFDYETTGKVPGGLSGKVEIVFSVISTALDRDREAYEEICQRRSEYGKKGGRPPKKRTDGQGVDTPPFFSEKTISISEKAEKADKDNGNENENDNDDDNGKEEKKKEKESTSFPCGAPHADSVPTAPPVGPRLTREEKERLMLAGLPQAYLEGRETRAILFAEKRGKSVEEALLTWWREDKRERRRTSAPKNGPLTETCAKSYDLEDFWQAALERSYSS